MKWILPLVLLCSCATLKQDLKPFPAQSEACVKAQASASTAVAAAQCLTQPSTQAAEACWESFGEGRGLDILECEAVAFWQDVHQAAPAAQAIGTTPQTVQASAGTYLQAKGIATAPAAPPNP